MEYQYSDIEAHIHRAQELRSQAMGELLSTRWNALVSWFNSHTRRQLNKRYENIF